MVSGGESCHNRPRETSIYGKAWTLWTADRSEESYTRWLSAEGCCRAAGHISQFLEPVVLVLGIPVDSRHRDDVISIMGSIVLDRVCG